MRDGWIGWHLTSEDKKLIRAQGHHLVRRLHAAGYAHNKLFSNALFAARLADADGSTYLHCRLVNLTHAIRLRDLTLREKVEVIKLDFEDLDMAFAELDQQKSSRCPLYIAE